MSFIPVQTLVSKENVILYQLPHGKPDPKQNCIVGEIDKRDRVFQSVQKGIECWYYAAKMITSRPPKNPESFSNQNPYLINLREGEKLCSFRRKETKKADGLLNFGGHDFPLEWLDSTDFQQSWGYLDIKKAQIYLTNPQIEQHKMKGVLCEFVKQKEFTTVSKFLANRKSKMIEQQIKVHTNFIKTFCTTNKINFELPTPTNYDIHYYGYLSKQTMLFTTKKAFCLYDAEWKPDQTIDKLITELKNKGPLYVNGRLGIDSYVDKPTQLSDKLGGKTIYYWPKGSKRTFENLDSTEKFKIIMNHSVVLLGANKDKNLVYFVDPQDPSDPKQPELQKTYAISYQNLTQNCLDLHSYDMRINKNAPYALYSKHVKLI